MLNEKSDPGASIFAAVLTVLVIFILAIAFAASFDDKNSILAVCENDSVCTGKIDTSDDFAAFAPPSANLTDNGALVVVYYAQIPRNSEPLRKVLTFTKADEFSLPKHKIRLSLVKKVELKNRSGSITTLTVGKQP